MVNRNPEKVICVYLDCNNNIRCGTKIIKKFGGVPYEGIVKEYDDLTGWYKITYEDGDSEEMTKEEVINHLKQNKKIRRGRVRKQILGQSTLHGEILSAKDSECFGHEYPSEVNDYCSIITYQNIGQQPKSRYDRKAIKTATAFKASKASVALYTELSINEKGLSNDEKFDNRMKAFSPKSCSIVSSNQKIGKDTPWNLVGGTALTIDEGFASHKTTQGSGCNPRGLGRWVWTRLRGR